MPKEIKVLCPECETEVPLKVEEAEATGRCPNQDCRLDVGKIWTRIRYENARDKMKTPPKKEKPKDKEKPAGRDPFED